MATVYILYSKSIDRYYVGSCTNMEKRLVEHNSKVYSNSYTVIASDWQIYLQINNLEYLQARKIEEHIKRMKSIKYIKNMIKYPNIILKLKEKYK